MEYRLATIMSCIALTATPPAVRAQMSPDAAAVLNAPIEVERSSEVEIVPLAPHMGKFVLQAAMNGIERSFIFDTGSPTLISKELAEELGLTIIGSNTGRDANGKEVTTQIAVVDRLTIGGLTFKKVPVLIADFSASDPNKCFLDGGTIGSEIFPNSVWHIDTETQVLQIAKDVKDIRGLDSDRTTVVTDLHIGGYPYPPVFDYAFGKFADRGLFDTGNSDTVVLFDRVLQDRHVRQAIPVGSMKQGRGTHGVSTGGTGDDSDLFRFEVEGFTLGAGLPRLPATTRNVPPSLIGLGLLDRYSVTLDYVTNQMHMHERSKPDTSRPYPGFAVMMSDGAARVVQLFEDSSAQRAGLMLGDEVAAIDGRTLLNQDEPCSLARWLAEDRPTDQARTVTVIRNGQPVELTIRAN